MKKRLLYLIPIVTLLVPAAAPALDYQGGASQCRGSRRAARLGAAAPGGGADRLPSVQGGAQQIGRPSEYGLSSLTRGRLKGAKTPNRWSVARIFAPFIGPPLSERSTMPCGSTSSSTQSEQNSSDA